MNKPSRYTTMRLTLLLGICLAQAESFTILPSTTRSPLVTRTVRPLPSVSSPPPPASSSSQSSLPPSLSSEVLSDAELVQAEFMNGMTHALLDFTTLWGAATVVIRLATVIGRLFILSQDLGSDSTVLPDELAFQVLLLGVACHGLVAVSLPKIQAHWTVPPMMTFPDRQAFRSLFRPAGLSWSQYKELHLCSMDWVTVEPGQVILNEQEEQQDDAVYWLYEGNVSIQSQGEHDHKHEISSDNTAPGLRLLGEKKLARSLRLDDHHRSSNGNQVTAVAGDSGATLLRINTAKLEKLLRHDPDLTSSVSRLAFQGMQDKLDALLWKETANSASDSFQPNVRSANATISA